MLNELPPIPKGTKEGVPVILPAESFSREENIENPELYSVFPYPVYGLGKPDIELARDTYVLRKRKYNTCWHQDQAQSALLGLVEETRQGMIARASAASHSTSRFPAFWNEFNDWVPDIDHGGNLQLALQLMLLQAEPGPTGKLHLFPAWPVDWDVDFKLHAPGKTLVEASLKGGKLASLKVTPSSREKDIVNWLGKHPTWKPFTARPSLSQGKPITASSQYTEPGYDAKLANDGDLNTRWASDVGARSGWLEIDLGDETEIGSVFLSEIEWKETRKFTIEVMQAGTWKEVARGSIIGRDREIPITPVKASRVRLKVAESANAININEFQVYPVETP